MRAICRVYNSGIVGYEIRRERMLQLFNRRCVFLAEFRQLLANFRRRKLLVFKNLILVLNFKKWIFSPDFAFWRKHFFKKADISTNLTTDFFKGKGNCFFSRPQSHWFITQNGNDKESYNWPMFRAYIVVRLIFDAIYVQMVKFTVIVVIAQWQNALYVTNSPTFYRGRLKDQQSSLRAQHMIRLVHPIDRIANWQSRELQNWRKW